jgi:hypothetical protein
MLAFSATTFTNLHQYPNTLERVQVTQFGNFVVNVYLRQFTGSEHCVYFVLKDVKETRWILVPHVPGGRTVSLLHGPDSNISPPHGSISYSFIISIPYFTYILSRAFAHLSRFHPCVPRLR